MQKIIPFLWFDTQAEEAAKFYTSIFKNSKIGNITRYDKASSEVSGRPEGSAMTVDFEIEGFNMVGLNGGPIFNFTPAISFMVGCISEEEIDHLYAQLSKDGELLMEIGNYGFSEKFAWINDKFGVSWQLNLDKTEQKITPYFLFVGDNSGKVEEAMKFYTSLFNGAKIADVTKYTAGQQEPEGNVMHANFVLENEHFMTADSSIDHKFNFTEAVSLLVNCETQEEVDKLWNALSAVKESEQCGWLKDRYGVSWQIVPKVLNELLADPDPEKAQRVTEAMLKMKKIESADLMKAYNG